MKKEEFNLSEERVFYPEGFFYPEKDVKEAVKRLKEEIINKNANFGGYSIGSLGKKIVLEKINEIFGKKLIDDFQDIDNKRASDS